MTTKKFPNHLSKFIDEHLRNVSYYSQLLNGEVKLTSEDVTADERAARMGEVERIMKAIEHIYNNLDYEKKEFVRLYYHSPEKQTVKSVTRKLFISEKTGLRWKREIAILISRQLGWV